MIPATYPSILDSSNRTKMLVYQVPSIVGLTRWIDYIPVKSPTSESDLTLANTFANEGFILTSKVNDITGLVPFKDYVPIYLDSTATKAWSADNDGYIPMAELAGLLLDFTTGALDPRIAFTRTTNATVTNSAGLITYAPHNLLTYSEQFDNAVWLKGASTITANTIIAPDGTTTTDKLLDNATTDLHSVGFAITTTASFYTVSIYAKKSELNYIWLRIADASNSFRYAWFNLNTGTVGTVYPGITASILLANDGWYRCSISIPIAYNGAQTIRYGCSPTDNTLAYLGNGTSGIYIWGAQLEIGSTATTYNSTTVKNLLGYSELFDSAAWTKSNSFVQTNLLKYSEDFSVSASWNAASGITSNTTIAPNGYQTADTIDVSLAIPFQVVTCTASTVYTYSAYIQLGTLSAANFKFAVRDDTAGVFIAQDIVPTETLTTGSWTKITYTFTTPVGCVTVRPYLYRNSAGATGTFFAWGAQLVQGSVAGDYRRTDATALPVYYPNHNGVVCAEKLVESTATALHYPNQVVSGGTAGTYVLSVYAKAAERTWVSLQCAGTAVFPSAYFDLLTGTVGTSDFSAVGSIVSVGNGYYRCALKFTTDKAPDCRIYIATANGTRSYTGDGTSGIYIFGAQLSDSASLDPYVLNAAAAPTAAAYYGARFDYAPVTLQPKGLLIEEQRTNTLTYSEDYTQAVWTKGGSTISANAVNAPSGTQTADKIVEDTTNAPHYIFYSGTLASATYTFSVYIKQAGRTWVKLALGQTTQGTAYFNLSTGVVGTVTSGYTTSITPVGNDWYRCTISGTGAGTVYQCVVYAATADGVDSYAGDITKGIYAWGAQLEAGAFATSYIPTAASQVTRAADVATIQGSNFYGFYNQNEGSVSAQSIFSEVTSAQSAVLGIVLDTNNRIQIGKRSGGGAETDYSTFVTYAGATQAQIIKSNAVSINTNIKSATSFINNNFAQAVNNTSAIVDTSGTLTTASYLSIGASHVGFNYLNGTIKSISYYPQKLSSDVLKGLTA